MKILRAFARVFRLAVPFLGGRGTLTRVLARRFALPVRAVVVHFLALAILRLITVEIPRLHTTLAALSRVFELAVDSLGTLRILSVAVVPAMRAVTVTLVLRIVLPVLRLPALTDGFVARETRAGGAAPAMFGAIAF